MGGKAWPILVNGKICLVNLLNERDLDQLINYVNFLKKLKERRMGRGGSKEKKKEW
jgi:hypothetical protein